MAEVKLSIIGEDSSKDAYLSVGKSNEKMRADSAATAKAISGDMSAAKDSVAAFSYESSKSIEKLNDAAEKISFEKVSKKISASISPELIQAEQRFHEFVDKVEGYVKNKIAVAAVALIVGVSAAIVGALYTAYQSIGFLMGLLTGDSYKSKQIDALIAVNKEVKSLQDQLQLTAVDANTLNDAIRRLGVDKGDYVAVYQNSETAIRSNREELDRLGVKYTDVNGTLLENRDVVQNAKNVLDQYSAGWDRNQAATAIGMGSYAQINNYLKVNQQEFRNSKERLDEYNLGIGTESQAAVSRYQAAMLEFNNETKLMGDGFKRVWADVTMPLLTNFAEYLKDGWPSAVNVFRYTTASIASLLIGLDESVYISVTSIIAGLTSIVDVGEGVGYALIKILEGDLSGAADELSKGWHNAEKTISDAGSRIVDHSRKNAAAMKLAWAFDDRQEGNDGKPKKGGKTWEAAPAAEDAAAVEAYSRQLKAYEDAYLRYSQTFDNLRAAAVKNGNAVLEAININSYEQGLIDLQTYLAAKHRLNEESIQAEIAARKSEVGAAKLAFDAADARDKVDGGDLATQTERLDALTKLVSATGGLQKAENDLRLARVNNTAELKKMTDAELAAYKAIDAQYQTMSGSFAAAERIRQEAARKTSEYLKMEAAARAGNADASRAITEMQRMDAAKLIEERNRENDATRAYAQATAGLRDELARLRGEDQTIIDAEIKLRDGREKMAVLQNKIAAAWAQGNAVAISALSTQIQLQDQLNDRLIAQRDYLEQVKVLTGAIVGFNNGQPIYANAGGSFSNGVAVPLWQSPAAAAAGILSGGQPGLPVSDPFGFNSMFSNSPGVPQLATGTNYIPSDGYYYLHKREAVVPEKYNPALGNGSGTGVIIQGGINITLPNVTNNSCAADLARELYPEIQKLARRQAA